MAIAAHKIPLFFGIAWLVAGGGCSPGGGAAPELAGSSGGGGGGECAHDNLTQGCTCGASIGSQVCTAAVWSSCDCEGAPGGPNGPSVDGGGGGSSPQTFPGDDRTDITFSWTSTTPPTADGSCPPGEYEGNLQGIYYSILAPGGLGVPIANLDLPGAPSGFHFVLSPAQGGETSQQVKGKLDGTADGLFPFEADITGSLNCRSATFSGTLSNGSYSILTQGLLPQSFDGVMSAHYDKRTHTFVDGSWDVKETTATPPGTLAPTLPRDFKRDGFGGSGQFAAALPTDLKDPKLTTCPTNYTCGAGALGPNKLLCNNPLGTPVCATDADCNTPFPGENVPCLKASLFSLCLRECKQ